MTDGIYAPLTTNEVQQRVAGLTLLRIRNRQNDLVGLLDTLRWYPDETTWWIDTLLFVPASRSQGLGRMVMQGFAEYVRASGGQAIRQRRPTWRAAECCACNS